MMRLKRLRVLTAIGVFVFALSATAAVYARYNSPYSLVATVNDVAFNTASATCTNPNFAHANNDGIGTAFVLTTGNSQAGTNFGYSIGRYNPEANSYTGLMAEHFRLVSPGTYAESFYPFSSIPLGSSATLLESPSGSGAMFNISINGTVRVTLNENLVQFNTTGTGIIQAIDTGGNPQYFAQFTTGSNCSSLAFGNNGTSPWPSNPQITIARPTLETTANGSYSSAAWTVTY